MKSLIVAAAVIIREGKVLVSRRKKDAHLPQYWEFPGGKKHEGEELADALIRELREELGIGIRVGREVMRVIHPYPDRKVELHFFYCDWENGKCEAIGCDEYRWIEKTRLDQLLFPPANSALIDVLTKGQSNQE
jgi:8-oxo-dGTP diphosphatase